MTFHKRKSGRNLADCDKQVELPTRAREVAVLEEEISEPSQAGLERGFGGGAEHNARQLNQGVIDLRTSGGLVDLPAVTRRCGLAESTYSASLPRISGGVERDRNYLKGYGL